MRRLVKGVLEFRRDVRPRVRDDFARLAQGQSPDALLVACSDSRVAPNVFASTEPGDLFVVRNVGNLVPPVGEASRPFALSAAAAVEFAVEVLHVSDIVVCGHSRCGGMQALLGLGTNAVPPTVHAWLRYAEPALGRLGAKGAPDPSLPPEDRLSQVNVLMQLDHLLTYPCVRDRVASGEVRLHGWWFDIAHAEVLAWESDAGRFVPIDDAEGERILARLGPVRPKPPRAPGSAQDPGTRP